MRLSFGQIPGRKDELIKRILVPTDFSPASLEALDYAVELAQTSQAELLIVYAIEPIQYEIPPLMIKQAQKDAAEKLAGLAARIGKRCSKCRTEVHFGVAYQVIVALSAKAKADLIVMSTHGHTSLRYLLVGSVAERVIHHSTCPVLVVPAQKRLRPSAQRAR
jgi:nucleotide-binding universal stress UspA family protein